MITVATLDELLTNVGDEVCIEGTRYLLTGKHAAEQDGVWRTTLTWIEVPVTEEASMEKDWREAYPVGSECEVWAPAWSAGDGWVRGKVVEHDHHAIDVQTTVGSLGASGRGTVCVDEHRSILRALPASKPAEVKRDRAPQIGDVWRCESSGHQWKITEVRDGGFCRGEVTVVSTLRYVTSLMVGDAGELNFNMRGDWTLITPAPEPLGEMLPNGFRVGERVEVDGPRWAAGTVTAESVNFGGICVARDDGRKGSGPLGLWCAGLGNHPNAIRRLTPAPTATPIHGTPGAVEVRPAVIAKPAALLCPCCKDTPLRLVGEAQDVYRCGHCSWTGNAEKLTAARAPERQVIHLFECPACGGGRLGDPRQATNGVWNCRCGWSGGRLLAAAKREATRKPRKFAIGDMVRIVGCTEHALTEALHYGPKPAQVMEHLDDGDYLTVDVKPWAAPHDADNRDEADEVSETRMLAEAEYMTLTAGDGDAWCKWIAARIEAVRNPPEPMEAP